VILNMKSVLMAHLVALILCPQQLSDFKHEICANGSPHHCDSVSLVSEFRHMIGANSSPYHCDSVSSVSDSECHGYRYTHRFCTGLSMGMGTGSHIWTGNPYP